jgi:hypothetical protein
MHALCTCVDTHRILLEGLNLSLKKWIQSDQLLMCDRYNFKFWCSPQWEERSDPLLGPS